MAVARICFLSQTLVLQINLNGRLLPLPRSAHGRPSVADILKARCLHACTLLAGLKSLLHLLPLLCCRSAHCMLVRHQPVPVFRCPQEYQEQFRNEASQAEAPDLQVQEAAAEMVRGVSQYFDQGLHHFLLYPHELQQAEEVVGAIRPPTPAVPLAGEPR